MAKQPTETKPTETKADKFVRLAEQRVGKAIKAIGNCQSLANKNSYEFSEEQVSEINNAIRDAVLSNEKAFSAALQGKKAKAATGFTFRKGDE